MLAVIQYSFNAVMPIILLIALGVFARRAGFLDAAALRKINKFNFRFNFFAMMFINVYGVASIRQMPVRMGVFLLAAMSVLFALGFLLSGVFTRERFRRGVLVQAMFRSNYVIIGIPVAVALVGEAGGQMAAFLQLPAVVFYNFMSVLVLSIFADYEAQYRWYKEGPLTESAFTENENTRQSGEFKKRTPAKAAGVDVAKIIRGLVNNPLIQGMFAGLIALLIREVIPLRPDGELVFSLQRDIPWIYSPLQSLSRMATPLALIVLGGQLEMKEIEDYRKELIAGIIMRLLGAPLVGFAMLFAAVSMGLISVGPVEIAVLVAIFGSPQAVASIVMTTEMGGDGHLAGQIVAWSSVFGMISLFFIIFFLRMGGLL